YSVKAGIAPEPDPATGEWTSAVFDGISEYYVNFGPLGVFLLSILNGYYFVVLYDWLVVRSKPFFCTALFTYLLWFTWPDNSGFFRRMLSDTRMLAVWLILFFAITRINKRLLRGQPVRMMPVKARR